MTALHALSTALSLHDEPPSPPSDEFEFESEYVRSLLKQRTPSPIIPKPANGSISTTGSGKENLDRWKTPITIGASAGRTVLAQRDMNSALTRSASVIGFAENTPAVKLTSSYLLSVGKVLK